MTRRTDLMIVGGGPAGAGLAALAAARGVDVTVVERRRFPRDKVCGEFVAAEGAAVLDRLGLLEQLRRAGGVPMSACRVTDRRGKTLDIPLPSLDGIGRDGLGISRALLDHALLDLAAARGARVLERTEAVHPIFEGGRVAGFRVRNVGAGDDLDEIRAGLVVAADGRRSVLARSLHPDLGDPQRSGPGSWFGLKTHLTSDDAPAIRRVELHLFDGGYAGLAPVEADRFNLCLLTRVRALRECGGSPDRLLRERVMRNPAVRHSFGCAERSGPWSSIGPLRFGARRAVAAGCLFVGDAAGTIDPFCGEGISNALVGAELALPVVVDALAGEGLTAELARRYEEDWQRSFAGVTRRVRRLGRLFEHPALAGGVLAVLRGAGRALAPRLVEATRTGSRRSA